MTAKISILTTCTITLATALTNLTPLEARTMEGDNFTSYQEEINQTTFAYLSDEIGMACIWVPGKGWVGNCDNLN